MQKWKVCKKLMAVILTLCMALPLISNQYLVVRAEETGTGTTTSYMDVDDLQIGTNKVRWEKETVSYPISNSETSTWTGKVLHIDKLDDESYTLKFKYDGDTSNLVYELYMYSYENGCMIPHGSIMVIGLGSDEGYCYLQGGYEYWINIRNDLYSEDQTEENDITVELQKNTQYEESDITEVTGALEENIKVTDYMLGSFKGTEINGKMYKITLSPDTKVKIQAFGFDDDALSINVLKKNDNQLEYAGIQDNYLENLTDQEATYYIYSGYYGCMQEFRVVFGEIIKQTTPIDIDKATVTDIKVGENFTLSKEEKQRLKYDYLQYRDTTKDASTITTEKKEAHWARLCVPEGCVYEVIIPKGNITMMKYDSNWNVYERLNLEYGNSGDYWEATEGTYYFYSTNDNEANISVTELSDVSTIKENAVEITEENVKNGQVEHENGSKFYKYCSAMLDGKANYQASLGVLYKITVPAGAIYVVDGTVGYAIVYDSEFNYVTNNGKMENTSNEAKSYYVWKVTHSYDENANMQIKTITSKLAEEKTNATLLQVGTSETYQYDDSDDTYISMLAYNYGESTYVIENAKVYAVDPGIYTLNVKSDNPDVNAKLYLFETDDLHVHTGDLLDYESGYSTKLNLSEEKNVPIKLLNKGYLVISGDASHLDSSIVLTLNKDEDNRLSQKTDEICEIYNGENECISEHDIYTVVTAGDGYNIYNQLSGVWYKYNLDAYTEVEITVPLSGEMYVYSNPEEPAIRYIETYGGSYTYKYKNEEMTPCELYICVQQNPSYTPAVNVITVDAYSLAGDITLKQSQATELKPGSFTTSKDGVDWVMMPDDYDENGYINEVRSRGKLYKLSVDSKSKVDIKYDDSDLSVFDDLLELPFARGNKEVVFNNLSKDTKVYYIWITGENDDVTGTVEITPLEKRENGNKIETTIPSTGTTTVTIEEDKNSNEATIKTSSTEDKGISSEAIEESIKIANQYNSDNEGETKITSIQTSYTDGAQATVSSDVLNSLKDAEVSLEVSKKASDGTIEYTWSFDADSLKETDVTSGVNTKLEVFEDAEGYEDQKVVDELTDPDATKCVVAFAHDGKLPKNTKVTIAVGDQYADGTTVYYYHINKETNILEPIDSVVVENGMVTLVLSHCSDYVICDKKVCKHEKTEVRNAKKASCTEAGYTGDTYCVDCDAKLATGEVIAKKDHTSSDWIVDKAATVDAEGSRHKECTVCKTVLAKEAIAKLPAPTPTPEPVVIPDVTIRYTTHVQTFGWQGDENNANKWFVNGKMAGTSGKAKRLEGIKIRVYGNDNLGIQYTTHCQSYGWLPWSANGEMNGTEGEAKRLEAIKIQLTGADKDKYDVYYRVHAQSYGWLGWAKNGAPSGTAGYAKRLEGIQIVVVKKGAAAPGVNYAGVNAASGVHQAKSYIAKAGSSPVVGNQATSNTNPSVAGEANVNVAYRTHVQTFGWQGWKYNGQISGTSGQAKRLEGINIKLTNKPYSGSIVYTTHVQTYGWQGNENNPNTWRRDGDMSGTSGEAKRLEAIRIALTGEMAEHYDVYYRVHAQSFGWLGWAKNGEAAGTAGLAKRLEGIQIVLVPKGGNAPARSYQGITSVKTQAYIKK